MKGLGIIGLGAMGSALARRMAMSEVVQKRAVFLADVRREHVASLADQLGSSVVETEAIGQVADTIILAVKPGQVGQVLSALRPSLTPEHLLISIAAGISLGDLAAATSLSQPIIRAMPNTPCLIGKGAIVLSSNNNVSAAQLELAQRLLEATGRVWLLPEEQMDAVTAVSGSGPAYVYLFLEALIDGGVAAGLSYSTATELAIQTAIGAIQMMMETEDHPAVLRNMVTSPAGTTAAALREFEKGNFRSTLIEAVLAAWDRSKELQGE